MKFIRMPRKGVLQKRRVGMAKHALSFNPKHASEELFKSQMLTLKIQNYTGRRAIAFRSIFEFVEETNQHSGSCAQYKLELEKEVQTGLSSHLSFRCICGWKVSLDSDHSSNSLPVNKALVWGCQNSAIGRNSLNGLMTALDLTTPSAPTYHVLQADCKNDIMSSLEKEIILAGEEEKAHAIASEDFVTVRGVEYPAIRVILDGGWGKRSYGHGYNSNCGVAVIIGSRTGKVLHMGTRTKTCFQCAVNLRTGKFKNHDCGKNWTGSSTAMESSIILEGFQRSISNHGLVYSSFVGDGDSSVHSTIQYG